MATVFGLEVGEGSYPEGPLYFGINPSTHSEFVMPVARFTFYKPNGIEQSDAPTIYVRMGGTFNTSLLNAYQEQAGIFGNPGTGTEGLFATLEKLGGSGLDALQSQILKGISGAAGFISSAGVSGRRQVEFLQRRLVNEFQQLIYTGPTFRRFQLPFALKPLSKTEAEAMRSIIQTFRVASSPKARGEKELGEEIQDSEFVLDNSTTQQQTVQGQQIALQNTAATITGSANDLGASEDVLTFDYPELCKFEILLYQGNQGTSGGETISKLFESDLCAIETVSVDYGSQNKMTFFNDDTGTNYYPTDVNLTIALRETVLVTAQKAANEFVSGRTIL